MMLTMMDCPWCDDQMVVDAANDAAECATCVIRVDLAPDYVPGPAVAEVALAA